MMKKKKRCTKQKNENLVFTIFVLFGETPCIKWAGNECVSPPPPTLQDLTRTIHKERSFLNILRRS